MKRQIKRSKSQVYDSSLFDNEVVFTVLLSKQEQITVPIPLNCPLQIINSTLIKKISERQNKTVVGFQSFPFDYSFDYKMSKNIGKLNGKKNITLNCLYKSQSVENNSDNSSKLSQNSPFDFQLQYFKKIAKYKICKPLSSGGFSRVYLVRNMENGQFYAAKFMEKDSNVNADREEAIRNQFSIHKSLDHPYIVKMEEYFETDNFYVLIMEYCPGGQLFTLLKNNRYMAEEKARIIFIQILIAIKHLHERNIVFRDIKPENILIDAFGNAKVTDFGLAKQIREKTNSYCGSVEYMAPEIISKQSYTFDVDLYCMGALLYEILIGCPPFYNPNFTNNETKYHICHSQVSFPRKVVLSDEVKHLISSLLVKNPTDRLGHRYGVDEVLEHEWISETSIQAFMNCQIKNPFVPNLDIENFDRQEDENEMAFRNKILKEFKKCKKIFSQMNFEAKNKQSSEPKIKSQSVFTSPKKHMKFKSQENLKMTYQKIKTFQQIRPIIHSIKKSISTQNPYSFSIKNKSISQIINCYKSAEKNEVDRKIYFKKKKDHRSLSKSINKTKLSGTISPFDSEIKLKSQMGKILMVNSKSCENSRKNTLYKKFIQNNNDSKSNKLDLMSLNKKAKILQSNVRYQSIAQSTSTSYTSQEKLQPNMQKKSSIKDKNPTKQNEELYIPKQTFEKENNQGKGLKKKLGNKKYMFASAIKDTNKIKNSHFTFQDKNFGEKQKIQNRQTIL